MAANDKVTKDLAGDTIKSHVGEAFKVYAAQLVRAQNKYAVGNPVYVAYAQTIQEVEDARQAVLAKFG